MKLYLVRAYRVGLNYSPDVSRGFSSRQAAERFAAGLSAAGKCGSVDICPYEDDEQDDDAGEV